MGVFVRAVAHEVTGIGVFVRAVIEPDKKAEQSRFV
jgi:hypothetical protein